MPKLKSVLPVALCLVLLAVGSARGQTSTLAEKLVSQLPPEPLVWRIETFASKAAAEAAVSAVGLVAEAEGRVWLFTLGPKGGSSPDGTLVIEIGPIPVPPTASQYRLRVEQNIAAAGERTNPHSHPGPESWYVLAGEVCLRTSSGNTRARAGQGLIGPASGTSMQSLSTGLVVRRAFVLTVFDATKPRILPGSLPQGSC
jgi:quercetin dioxygenase-like cupin family protein